MPDMTPHPGSWLLLLRQSEQAIRRRIQPALDEAELTQESWRIVAALLHHPGSTMAALAEAAAIPGASLTRHMDRLVELGYTLRRVDPTDKRRAVIALSPRGTELALRLRTVENAIEESLNQAWGPDRLASFAEDLSSLPHVLERDARVFRDLKPNRAEMGQRSALGRRGG